MQPVIDWIKMKKKWLLGLGAGLVHCVGNNGPFSAVLRGQMVGAPRRP